ncbi:MAG: 23S rRNA (pseudouridine(1915)-N(3))-methyltransferase RlmH [Parvularculales bacterium]
MKLHIGATGRIRSGPEQDLVQTYLSRAVSAGQGLGFHGPELHEVDVKQSLPIAQRQTKEADLLRKCAPDNAIIVALDRQGHTEDSETFAARLADWRDSGIRDLIFMIGGADGLDAELCAQARFVLALGPMTWPHGLVRIMLTEQIYRALTILNNHPYHHGH